MDIANAARAAQAYGGLPAAREMPQYAPPVAPGPTPTASPADRTSAPSAADAARDYFALIAAGDYGAAWRSWDRDGAASGMSEAAFAASFEKYRSYRAEVGPPGPIEAGAGQRHVSVPVRVSGQLRSGENVVLEGPVTLHRVGDVDGASDAQRRWRISDSALRPSPPSADAPAPLEARYRCIDGTRFRVTFDDRGGAELSLGERTVRLTDQRPASGIWYARDGYDLRGKGKAATLTRPEAPPLPCTAR